MKYLLPLILITACTKPVIKQIDQASPPRYEEFSPPPPEIADQVDQFGEPPPKKVKKKGKHK